MMEEPRYSVVIPVFNEADAIAGVVAELLEVLSVRLEQDGEFEVILVDDGSSDATLDILQGLAAAEPRLRVLAHDGRASKSAALRSGIRVACAPWILTMDGDGQNDPRDLSALLAAARAEARPPTGLVAGVRQRRIDTIAKRLASRFANGLRRLLLRDTCPDTGCGLKAVRRDLFLAFPFFDSLHRYLPALTRRYGYGVALVPVDDRARAAGSSKYSNLDRAFAGFFDLMGVVWLLRRTTPVGLRDLGSQESGR